MDAFVAVSGILMGLFLVYRAFGGKGPSIPGETSQPEVLGQPSEHVGQVRTDGSASAPAASSGLVKCASCGARVSRKDACDYCGAHLP
jgi:hypothetical protein